MYWCLVYYTVNKGERRESLTTNNFFSFFFFLHTYLQNIISFKSNVLQRKQPGRRLLESSTKTTNSIVVVESFCLCTAI